MSPISSLKLFPEDELHEIVASSVQFLCQPCDGLVDEFLGGLGEHVEISFFVVVVIVEESAGAVPSAFDLLGDLLVQSFQQTLSFLEWLEVVVGPLIVLLRDVKIFKLKGVVSANSALNLLSLAYELSYLLVVIIDHFLGLVLLLCQLLLQFYLFQHVDLFLQQIVDEQFDQSRDVR